MCPGEQDVSVAGTEIKSASTGNATQKYIQVKPDLLPSNKQEDFFLCTHILDLDHLAGFSTCALELLVIFHK